MLQVSFVPSFVCSFFHSVKSPCDVCFILQATSDLEGIDKKRKEEFKTYELEKEHLHKEKLASLDEKQRLEEQKKWDEMQEKHKKHPKLHHPVRKVLTPFNITTTQAFSQAARYGLFKHEIFKI